MNKSWQKNLHNIGSSSALSASGIKSIVDEMKGLDEKSVFLDLGSGSGFVCIYIAMVHKCMCYGVEIESDIVGDAQGYAESAGVTDLCRFECADIRCLSKDWLKDKKITHVYAFDKVFMQNTFDAMVAMVARCTSIKTVVSNRKAKSWNDVYEDIQSKNNSNTILSAWSLYDGKAVSLRMAGGAGQSFTFRVLSTTEPAPNPNRDTMTPLPEQPDGSDTEDEVVDIVNPPVKEKKKDKRKSSKPRSRKRKEETRDAPKQKKQKKSKTVNEKPKQKKKDKERKEEKDDEKAKESKYDSSPPVQSSQSLDWKKKGQELAKQYYGYRELARQLVKLTIEPKDPYCCGDETCPIGQHKSSSDPACYSLGPCIICNEKCSDIHCHELFLPSEVVIPQSLPHDASEDLKKAMARGGAMEKSLALYFENVLGVPRTHEIYSHIDDVISFYGFAEHINSREMNSKNAESHWNPVPLRSDLQVCTEWIASFDHAEGCFTKRTVNDPGVICCILFCGTCKQGHNKHHHKGAVTGRRTACLTLNEPDASMKLIPLVVSLQDELVDKMLNLKKKRKDLNKVRKCTSDPKSKKKKTAKKVKTFA